MSGLEALHPATPIGIFDSGVGGLSVLRAVWQELPGQPVFYLADQAHVPYGPRPLEEVRRFSEEITRFLLSKGAGLIVVACNAASAASLLHLRATFTDTPIVGMEPAVKPAAEQTRSGAVGVLATPATFQGALYASVVERFANGVELIQDTCPGLVGQIEAGRLNQDETRSILEKAIKPMLAAGIDTIVLGCTHYPFVIPLIEEIAGSQVRVIDPAPAVARQVRRQLEAHALQTASPLTQGIVAPEPATRFITTGDPQRFSSLITELLGVRAKVDQAAWHGGDLVLS